MHGILLSYLSGTTSCYLEKINYINGYPYVAASLEPMAHCRNVASLSLFYKFCLDLDFYLNCLNWFHFLILEGGLLFILIDCLIFLSPFSDVTRMSM